MKRIMYLSMLSLVILAVLLAACSQAANRTSGISNPSLSEVGQLLVGTLKLEGTRNAVDAKEAAALLPLWQAYRQLSTSDTTAPAEMTAVVSQIQSTMTSDQFQAITSMKLTQKDLSAAVNSIGMISTGTTSSSGATSVSSALSSGTTNLDVLNTAGDPQGAGGDPTSGSILGTGTNLSSTAQISTPQATAVSTPGIPASLLNSLIDLLQKRAGTVAG